MTGIPLRRTRTPMRRMNRLTTPGTSRRQPLSNRSVMAMRMPTTQMLLKKLTLPTRIMNLRTTTIPLMKTR